MSNIMKVYKLIDNMRGTLYLWTKAKSYEEAEKRLGNEWFSAIEEVKTEQIKSLPKHLEVKKGKRKTK